jgi:hypothetical protein
LSRRAFMAWLTAHEVIPTPSLVRSKCGPNVDDPRVSA